MVWNLQQANLIWTLMLDKLEDPSKEQRLLEIQLQIGPDSIIGYALFG